MNTKSVRSITIGAMVAMLTLFGGAGVARAEEYPPATIVESGPDYTTPENLPTDTLAAKIESESTAIVQAVDKGDGWLAAAMVLSLLVWLARKGGARFLPDGGAGSSAVVVWLGRLKRWMASGEGGVTLTLLGAACAGLITVLASHIPFGWVWVTTTFKVGLASMGGWVGAQKLFSEEARAKREARAETTGKIASGFSPTPPALAFAILLLLPGAAFGQAQLAQVTAAQTGLSGALLSGSPQTAAIAMNNPQSSVSYDQLTLAWTAVAGTSTTMTVTCTGSLDQGQTFRPIERCADGTTFTCTAATWSYDLTTQTSALINIPSNYWAIKCVFAATGTGTITVTGVKNTI